MRWAKEFNAVVNKDGDRVLDLCYIGSGMIIECGC